MKDEVAKEAAWNTELRRKLRPLKGVASREVVSTPSIRMEPDLSKMTPMQQLAYLRQRYPRLKINER